MSSTRGTPAAGTTSEDGAVPVLVWDVPTRLFHWSLVASVATAWLTGGTGSVVHEISGCLVAGLIGFRIIWGLVGTRHARFADFVRTPWSVMRYLGSIVRGRPTHHLGHNPAGGLMILALLLVLSALVVSGFAMLTNLFFGVSWVEDLHSSISSILIALIALHVLGVLVASLLHREHLVSAMITGWKKRLYEVSESPEQRFRQEMLTRVRGSEGMSLLLVLAVGGLAGGWLLTSGRGAQGPASVEKHQTVSLLHSLVSEASPTAQSQPASASTSTDLPALASPFLPAAAQIKIDELVLNVRALTDRVQAQDAEIARLVSLVARLGEPSREAHQAARMPPSATIGDVPPVMPAEQVQLQPATPVYASACLDLASSPSMELTFSSSLAALDRANERKLQRLARLVAPCPYASIELVGYTDDRGSKSGNLMLALRRAEAAAQYLNGQGIDSGRLRASAEGDANPVADNGTREGRARNRRLEIVVSLSR